MTYEQWSDVWRSMTDVFDELRSVYLPGDLRALEDTRSTIAYPALIVRDPQVRMTGRESRVWDCDILLVNVHNGKRSGEDKALEDMYALASAIVYLLQEPLLLGFGYSVEAINFTLTQTTFGADNSAGWVLSFAMNDESGLCAPDAEGVPGIPSARVLQAYASDELAQAAGVSVGHFYLLSENNEYGGVAYTPRRIPE